MQSFHPLFHILNLLISEVVYVGLMNHLHYEVVLKALDNGKHVVCEKPFAPNYKQAKTMVDKAKEKKLFLMEGAWSRFFPAWQLLRKEIKEKKLGQVKSVFANFGVILVSKITKMRKNSKHLARKSVYVGSSSVTAQ